MFVCFSDLRSLKDFGGLVIRRMVRAEALPDAVPCGQIMEVLRTWLRQPKGLPRTELGIYPDAILSRFARFLTAPVPSRVGIPNLCGWQGHALPRSRVAAQDRAPQTGS